MKEIPLTQDKVALVDDNDYDFLMQWKWSYANQRRGLEGYAVRAETVDGVKKTIYMHRVVLSPLPNEKVDHKNRNSLDNQRSNLRVATHAQNKQNETKRRTWKGRILSSQFKGVSWYPRDSKWRVSVNGTFIGFFANELDAAHAYDAAARIYHGEFAKTNF